MVFYEIKEENAAVPGAVRPVDERLAPTGAETGEAF